MDKRTALEALKAEMEADTSLPLQTNLVFGEGNPDCDVLFIGEAPGQNEDVQKRPFVGRGGQLLRTCIRGIGWKEADVYITNIVKRRPPENRDPLPEELAAYTPYLTRQIAIISPKIIVPLGRFSMNYFLPEAKITRDQGKPFRIEGRLVVPMFHPAAALRATGVMQQFREGFTKLPQIIAGTVASQEVQAPLPRKESAPPQKSLF
ncbi:MAG: uracil-DNA glycosylase [Candidatus Liptonbacteria bacterium]|nr:uracil-DNA glycosylase [Candidatus Liptonbacteria bacterium]